MRTFIKIGGTNYPKNVFLDSADFWGKVYRYLKALSLWQGELAEAQYDDPTTPHRLISAD
jgi:hypothetical protein